MQNNRVELLAPAGNAEGFYGAIHAGADAVYLGGNRFGARAYADNFTEEELVQCIRYAHLWGRKVYLTVNTLVKESEFQDIYEYLLPYYEAGMDGVIVQDIGVFAYIRDHFPGMELHVSTQMTLTGVHGAKLLQDMGAYRIVPSRELSLAEIKKMKEETGLSIEAFIHGAMCYCYSGQCLFSSILGGRSGNRGRCAQPCRLPYRVKSSKGETDECYPLSLKDMCTIEHLPELIASGIDSFKIEGRMKKPEYTAGVTAIYRKYIDRIYESGQLSKNISQAKLKIDAEDMHKLSHLYIRSEIQNGYYYKHNGKDMVTLDSPAYSGSDDALLAQIRQRYLEKKPKCDIAIYAEFTTGNVATITFVYDDLSVTVTGDVVDTASKQPISRENIAKQLGKLGESIFAAETMEITVSEDAFYPLRSMNELRRKAVSELEGALIEKNGFPVRRNNAVSVSVDDADEKYDKIVQKSNQDTQVVLNKSAVKKGNLHISVRRKEQLQAIYELIVEADSDRKQNDGKKHFTTMQTIRRIYLDANLFDADKENTLCLCAELSKHCELVIALPYILRDRDEEFLANSILFMLEKAEFSGILVRSAEGMGIVRDFFAQNNEICGKIYTDAGFYIWNQRSLEEWVSNKELMIAGFCLPLELKGAEQRALITKNEADSSPPISCEKVVYGRAPMMLTANCVANTTTGCRKGSGEQIVELIDRYHKKFPVELNCRQCMNIIYNSVPLSLHGEMDKWKQFANLRLDFTVETAEETGMIAEYFGGIRTELPYQEYTTGHEKRGVE